MIQGSSTKALEDHIIALQRSHVEKLKFNLNIIYKSTWFQLLVAVLIFANFVISVVQAEIREPCGSDVDRVLNVSELHRAVL